MDNLLLIGASLLFENKRKLIIEMSSYAIKYTAVEYAPFEASVKVTISYLTFSSTPFATYLPILIVCKSLTVLTSRFHFLTITSGTMSS